MAGLLDDAPTVRRKRQKVQAYTSRGRDVPPELAAAGNELTPVEQQKLEEILAGELLGAGQVGRAVTGVQDAYADPSLANVTNAGVQSALAAFRPLIAGGIAGAGLLEAGRRDLMGDGGARAQSFLTPEQRAELKDAKDKLSKGKFGSGAERRTLEATVNRLNELDAELAKTQAGNVERQRAADAERKSTEDAAARGRANAAYQAGLDTDRRFSDTAVGQIFDKLGPVAPGAVAAATGLVSGLGMRGMGVTGKLPLYGVPMGAGTAAGAASAHWPMAYETMYAPTVNPSYQAALNYIREAPEGDPRAAQLKALIADGTLEKDNPVRSNAEAELYDKTKFLERSALGAIEGVVGGLAGGEAGPAIGQMIRSAPGAAYEVGRTPARAVRGLIDGLMEPSAARSGSRVPEATTPPPTPPVPPGQPPTVPNQQFRSYPALPDSLRNNIREAYIADRAIRGGDLPADAAASRLKDTLAASGISAPVTADRIRNTNAMASAEEAAGRKLTASSPAWSNKTLAIPAGLALGAAAMSPSEAEASGVNPLVLYAIEELRRRGLLAEPDTAPGLLGAR